MVPRCSEDIVLVPMLEKCTAPLEMVTVLSGETLRPTSTPGRMMFGRFFAWGGKEASTGFSGCLVGISGRMVVAPGALDPGRIMVGAALADAGILSDGVSEGGKYRGRAFGRAEFVPAGLELPGGFEVDIA
jgi:hypothetical protein